MVAASDAYVFGGELRSRPSSRRCFFPEVTLCLWRERYSLRYRKDANTAILLRTSYYPPLISIVTNSNSYKYAIFESEVIEESGGSEIVLPLLNPYLLSKKQRLLG